MRTPSPVRRVRDKRDRLSLETIAEGLAREAG
jgi:hypothetical protein